MWSWSGKGHAATYQEAPSGSDVNPGSLEAPWRKTRWAASRLQPGDTVNVLEGHYDERVTTVRGGAGDRERIAFGAQGCVSLLGFNILHPFVTVDGFTVERYAPDPSERDVFTLENSGADRDGSYCHLLKALFSR